MSVYVCACMLTNCYYDSLTIRFSVCVSLLSIFDVFHCLLYIQVGLDPEQ